MAQVVSLWPLTRTPKFDQGSLTMRFMVGKLTLGHVFLRVLWFSPQYHSTIAPYTFYMYMLLCKERTDEAWEPSKKQRSFRNRKAWIEKHFHFFFLVLKVCLQRHEKETLYMCEII